MIYAQILIDGTCVPVKEEIANPEPESVAKWNSFYHCVEWQNIAFTNIPHEKLLYILNVLHIIFEQLITPKWTQSTIDDPNLIKLWEFNFDLCLIEYLWLSKEYLNWILPLKLVAYAIIK